MSMITISVDIQDPAKREQLLLAVAAIVGSDAATPAPTQPMIVSAEQGAKPAKAAKAPKKAVKVEEAPAPAAEPPTPEPARDLTEEEMRSLCRAFASERGSDKLAALLAVFAVRKSNDLPRENGALAVREAMARIIGGAA